MLKQLQYLNDTPTLQKGKKKIDYKEVLEEESFQRFSNMRQIRKSLSQEEGIPAYAVFTDKELAQLAQLKELTLSSMRSVKGIGLKKVEKYGNYFLTKKEDEKSS